MATGMVIEAVLTVGVMVTTTANVALWAFRPSSYRQSPRARRVMGIFTVAWVILLPVGGAVDLGLSADALGIVTGGVALACWPVAILALRKRLSTYRSP